MLAKLVKLLFILAPISLLLSCGSIKHSFDYDNSYDFSQVKTYRWDAQPAAAYAKAYPLIDKRFVKAMEEAMQRKGFTQAESADVKMSYSVTFRNKLKSSNVSTGIGLSVGAYNRGRINVSSGNQLREVTVGTLVIDMISTSSNSLIWRSTSTKSSPDRDATPEQSQIRINDLISTVFENFPPKKK